MNEKPIFKQLNFKLTEKQLEDLEKLSNAMGNVSKSNLIRIAITEYIMKYKDLLDIIQLVL
jgi:metal-responsive CopG/Arc/MetJ family transcriptional regulator